MLEKIIAWSKKEEGVKALILLGSRAGLQPVDHFSDYDLSVFCDTHEPYTQTEEWLSQFGNVWVCVKEKVFCRGNTFPSRLVIFEGGIKVDFSFFSSDVLDEIVHCNPLPDDYNIGYKVLLDKENRTAGMLAPQFELKAIKPSEQEFHEVIKEFWFEVYHVGVYLKRKDLWSVKFRSWATQTFFLRMIEWHVQAENEWRCPPNGKRISSWVGKDLWQDLHGIFAHFDAEGSWKALFNTMELFRQVTADTAKALGFSNREDLSGNIIRFITNLKDAS
jgi:aminoglycoside 6-adenylyltransferase